MKIIIALCILALLGAAFAGHASLITVNPDTGAVMKAPLGTGGVALPGDICIGQPTCAKFGECSVAPGMCSAGSLPRCQDGCPPQCGCIWEIHSLIIKINVDSTWSCLSFLLDVLESGWCTCLSIDCWQESVRGIFLLYSISVSLTNSWD